MQAMDDQPKTWLNGLARTRRSTFGKIAAFFGASEISDATWEDLESLLIQSDIGVDTSLEIIEQVKKEKDKASKERLKTIHEEISNLKEKTTQLRTHWQNEKECIG